MFFNVYDSFYLVPNHCFVPQKNHGDNDPMYLAGPSRCESGCERSIINPESTWTKKVHFQVACFVLALLIETPILQEMSREVTHIHSELRGTNIILLCVSRSKIRSKKWVWSDSHDHYYYLTTLLYLTLLRTSTTIISDLSSMTICDRVHFPFPFWSLSTQMFIQICMFGIEKSLPSWRTADDLKTRARKGICQFVGKESVNPRKDT